MGQKSSEHALTEEWLESKSKKMKEKQKIALLTLLMK